MKGFLHRVMRTGAVIANLYGASVSAMPVKDEVVFLIDSSGSLGSFNQVVFQNQIGLARDLYQTIFSDDGSIELGLLVFSGCGEDTVFTPEQCGNNSRLFNEIVNFDDRTKELNPYEFQTQRYDGDPEYATPDPFPDTYGAYLDYVFDTLFQYHRNYFVGATSYLDVAIAKALVMFQTFGETDPAIDVRRSIVLFTDGDPTDGQAPWFLNPTTGLYEFSPTAQTFIDDFDPNINLVGVDINQEDPDEFFLLPEADFLPAEQLAEVLEQQAQSGQGGGFTRFSVTFPGSIVPVPASLWLLMAGFGALLAVRRTPKI